MGILSDGCLIVYLGGQRGDGGLKWNSAGTLFAKWLRLGLSLFSWMMSVLVYTGFVLSNRTVGKRRCAILRLGPICNPHNAMSDSILKIGNGKVSKGTSNILQIGCDWDRDWVNLLLSVNLSWN